MQRIEYPEGRESVSRTKLLIYSAITALLGVLVVVSIYIFQLYIQGGYYSIKWIDPNGLINMMEFGMQLFNPLRSAVWPGLCFFIGLALCICGIVHAVTVGKQMRLAGGLNTRGFALTYISLGVLFIAALIWYLGWLEPDWVSFKIIVMQNSEVTVYRDPVWIRQLLAWKVISFLLGIAVIGVGMIHLRRNSL